MSSLALSQIFSSESSSMLDLFEQISQWRRQSNSAISVLEFRWNELHISTIGRYFKNLSTTGDLPELPSARGLLTNPWQEWEPQMVVSFIQEFKEMFVVPRLNKFHRTQNRIKSQLIQAFLSFLLQLLYHKVDLAVDPFEDRIRNLEMELRSLLTILGDLSWTLRDAELQKLLPEFEGVANQAGSFVHYLFFSNNRSFEETYEGFAAVLQRIHILKSNLYPCVSWSPAYTTPRTSIADSIFVVYSVVDDLEDLLKREDDPVADVKDQVRLLHQELRLSLSSINDMRSPHPSEIEEVKEALMCIGGIAHQAEYLITAFLVKYAPLWYVFERLAHLTRMIEPIRTELQLITQQYQFGGSKVAEVPLHDERNSEVNDVIVGFEGKTIEILYQLVGGNPSLQFISILGMAGLGKTTLAKTLYSHPLVIDRFDKLAWCVVSQTYNTSRILANILIHVNIDLRKDRILEMEKIKLVEHIHKTLMGRRYMIVLDDVWDSNVLDELVTCFPDEGNGSRVFLTSRNKDVAPSNSIIHELPILTDEQCWELLEKKTFGCRTCPLQLQRSGKKIAAKCCGLPLTVVAMAGVLSTVDEEDITWVEVGRSLSSYIDGEENSVMQILELSYKHLPDHLKPCFLYFGEFKEDEEISVGNLKRLWVAEGFIRKEKDKSVENIAEEYLMKLIDKNLVMITKRSRDGRGAKSCVVHDLLRDLCLKISKEESFLKYLNNDYQHVPSFVKDHQSLSFCETLILDDLEHVKVMPAITKMKELRYMHVDHFPIENLNVEHAEVMPSITQLKELRFLHVKHILIENLNVGNHLNNLEVLSGVYIKNVQAEEWLKCLPRLRTLECTYDTLEIMDGTDDEKRECPHFDLHLLTKLRSLSLFGFLREDFGFPSNIRRLTLCESGLPWEEMSIVGRLEFLEVLKLKSDAFVGKRWDTRDGEFQSLKFMTLKDIGLSEWSVASHEHFPRLQRLKLIRCSDLQVIPSEIGDITTLKLIVVDGGCLSSVVESAERIELERWDMGNAMLHVIIGGVHATGNSYHTICEKDHRVQTFEETATLNYCQHVRDMRLLRILHFKSFYLDMPTFRFDYVVNLRFLVIENLPLWIDRLVNLEYVCVTEAKKTVYLPPAIVKMKKLRYLRAVGAEYSKDWEVEKELRYQTNNLEYLSMVTIRKLKNEELLKCTPHLRKLKCTYDVRRRMKQTEKRSCPHFDLRFLTQLYSLTLSGDLSKRDFGFPLSIRKLTLHWTGLSWEMMSVVGGLEFLEVLKLGRGAFVGERWDTSDGEFQKLWFLQLEYIGFSEWNVASDQHFPKLKQLILISCVNLREIPNEIGEITTLELIEVKLRCQKSVVESAERIKRDQQEMGNEELRVITGISPFVTYNRFAADY